MIRRNDDPDLLLRIEARHGAKLDRLEVMPERFERVGRLRAVEMASSTRAEKLFMASAPSPLARSRMFSGRTATSTASPELPGVASATRSISP